MESSSIRSAPRALAAKNVSSAKAAPTQGQLLTELLKAISDAIPASGTRQLTPQEIGEALKLVGNDLTRFIPLVVKATINSKGAVYLELNDEFRFRPVPEARELAIRTILRATAAPGKLTVSEGLAAIINSFVHTNIKSIEDATENNVRGVLVVAGLGSEFYPLERTAS